MKKLRSVLLIDDDPISNFLTRSMIEAVQECQNLTIKENGEQALDYLCSLPSLELFPNLILLDLNMPVLTGFEFLEKYYALSFPRGPLNKIVVLSTSSYIKDIDATKAFLCDYFITKPLTEEKFSDLIKKHFI